MSPETKLYIDILGSASSAVGLLLTLFLVYQAAKLRQSFVRRARLPEINKDLKKMASELSKNLGDWDTDKNPVFESLSNIRALLENVSPRLPSEERRKVESYLLQLRPRKYMFLRSPISERNLESSWALYTELSGLLTTLHQLEKDQKWD